VNCMQAMKDMKVANRPGNDANDSTAANGCCRLPKCDGVQSGISEPTFQRILLRSSSGDEGISSVDYKHPDDSSFRTVRNVDTFLPDCTASATSEQTLYDTW